MQMERKWELFLTATVEDVELNYFNLDFTKQTTLS